MPQYTYGGSPADVLTTETGDVVPDYPLLVRRAGTGETITALYEVDGTTPIGQLRTNPSTSDQPGAIRAFKVADVTAIEYEYNGTTGPVRWYEAGREVAQDALQAAQDALPRSGGTLTGKVQWGLAAAADVAEGSFVTGDPYDRYRRLVTGEQAWGPGNAARDVRFYRSAASTMRLTGTLDADRVNLAGSRVFDVRFYGAKGDGAADDAPAIQAAFDAAQTAGGGQVLVPPGTYRLATLPLRIWRNTRLTLLGGATLQRAAAASILTNGAANQNLGGYTGHGNIVIEGGVWDMRATASGLTAAQTCIMIGHAQGVTIRGIEVRDVPGWHGVEVNSSKDVHVDSCRFLGFVDTGSRDFSEAVQLDLAKGSGYFPEFGPFDQTPCEDVVVSGLYVGASGTAGTQAWPRGVGSHSSTIGVWHRRIKVENCSFEGCTQYAIGGYSWRDVVIAGNTMVNCGSGMRLRVAESANAGNSTDVNGVQTNASQPTRNATITGNTITGGTGFDDGIFVQGETTGRYADLTITGNTIDGAAGSGAHGIRVEYGDDCTIGGNVIRDVSGSGISLDNTTGSNVTGNRVRNASSASSAGIALSSCSEITLASNSLRELGQHGIAVTGGSDLQIVSNWIKGASRAASGAWGIRMSTSADGVLITGNRIRKYGSGAEAAYGISVTGTCTNVRRYGNDLPDSGTSGLVDDQSTAPVLSPFDTAGNLEESFRPAGRWETTSRLRCGTSSGQSVSGTLYLVPLWLPKGVAVSNLTFVSGATAVGTPTNYWFALFDRSRVAVARTADQTTAAWAANTIKTLAVAQTTAGTASSYTTTYTGLHYIGYMIKATTMPTLVGEGNMLGPAMTADPGFGDTTTAMSTPPTVTSGAFTAAAFGGNVGMLAYAYAS